MLKIDPIRMLTVNPPGVAPVIAVAVGDTFGATYRRCDSDSRKPGEVIEQRVRRKDDRDGPDGWHRSNFRILRKVEMSEVYLVLANAGRHDVTLEPGSWYEVHQD